MYSLKGCPLVPENCIIVSFDLFIGLIYNKEEVLLLLLGQREKYYTTTATSTTVLVLDLVKVSLMSPLALVFSPTFTQETVICSCTQCQETLTEQQRQMNVLSLYIVR